MDTKEKFLQTEFWAAFKARHGWKQKRFLQDKKTLRPLCADENAQGEKFFVLVREFNAKIKKFNIAYIPSKPEIEASEDATILFEEIENIAQKLKPFLSKNTIFIRFDPLVDYDDVKKSKQIEKEFRLLNKKSAIKIKKSKTDIQPPDTVLLNLLPSEKEILLQMKSKWRYNIRLAQKKGVEVKCFCASDEGFDFAFEKFFELFQITSERDGVQFHEKNYYLDLLKSSAQDKKNPKVSLYIASYKGEEIAAIITLFCAREAVYLYGASGNTMRNLMPTYLLQWTAICDAKKFGCPIYDFYGCPPDANENHPMHGLFLFKTGFGGSLVHRPGSFDAVLRPLDYALYCTMEKLRAWHFKVFRKKFARR